MHYENEYLAHYGILGMHWGVRRYQPYPDGYSGDGKYKPTKQRKTKLSKKQKKALEKQQKQSVRESIKQLNYDNSSYKSSKAYTDEELRNAIQRLKLEKEFRQLSTEDKIAGRVASRGLLAEYGKDFAFQATDSFRRDLAKNTGKAVSRKIVPHQKDK